MAKVEVTVNGRAYLLACDDGEENRLLELASAIDRRVSELAGEMGQLGEARLMLMVGLLMADELSEVSAEVEVLEAAVAKAERDGAKAGASAATQAAAAIDATAKLIEDIVLRLENA